MEARQKTTLKNVQSLNTGDFLAWNDNNRGDLKKVIKQIFYPGLTDHPHHDVAKKQMNGFGGMLTMVLEGGLPSAKKFLEKTKLFSLAESLGGVESLIEHPAIMTHASVPLDIRKKLGIDDGLVRLSVGIESIDDLIEDLEQALNGV